MNHGIFVLGQAGGLDSIFTNMGDGLRGRNGVEWVALGKLLCLLGGLALVVGLVVFIVARLLRVWRSTPTWLFLRLCRAQRLSWTRRWLLWRVARELELADPALVFVDPACIEQASALPAFFNDGTSLLELHTRLFAGADEEAPEAAPGATPVTSGSAGTTTNSGLYRRPSDVAAAIEDQALNELLTPPTGLPPLQWPNLPSTGAHDSALH